MAKMKGAPNAGRVSLYVPAANKWEDLALWHAFRGLCDSRGSSVFRELLKFIQRDLKENPPTPAEEARMQEFVYNSGINPHTLSPVTNEQTTEQASQEDLNNFSIG